MLETRSPGRRERRFLKACSHCGAWCLTLPHVDDLGRTYCSRECLEWLALGPSRFCERCIVETTDRAHRAFDLNGVVGTTFLGRARRCPTCRSVVRRVWLYVFYLPLVPLRRYRVIHSTPRDFVSRRLRVR